MKYIEYVYLTLACMSLIFMVTEFERLSQQTVILMCISMGVFAFMFSFRRNQRKVMEKRMEEEMDDVWAELAQEEEDDDKKRETEERK